MNNQHFSGLVMKAKNRGMKLMTDYDRRFFMRLALGDQILFIKQLSMLMRAGMPILSSLKMLKEQSKSRSFNFVMNQVIRDVENGQYLATALGKCNKIFGELIINIIAVGEISGSLSENLDHLALALKKKQALRRKIISASVYPVFIVIATIAIAAMLTTLVFPKIIPIFQSINYQLPWTTRFLIFLSTSLRDYGFFIFLGVLVLIVAIALLLKNKKVRAKYDRGLMHVPFLKKMLQAYNVANICKTMGLLLKSGIPVTRALHIASSTTANLAYKKELDSIAQKVAQGEIISFNIAKCPTLFPVAVSQIIQVGESTGKLSETFSYLADSYEEEMDELTKNLSTAVEPLLLIFMGILVGFIAISIITPIYGITQQITSR